MSTPVVVTE
jgi:hypothetical protein